MKLLALLLLLGMVSLSVTEVVHSFKHSCPEFFIRNDNDEAIAPTVLKGSQYKQICQFYEGDYRFATLYDTKRKIPVYSAYTYNTTHSTSGSGNVPNNWKIEPQLDELPTDTNREMRRMTPEERLWKQAQNKDYESTYLEQRFTRGHVFPKSYALGSEQKESTFTLTNAAPQTDVSNAEWAKKVEEPMLKVIKKFCDNSTLVYIVTGVVPGDVWLKIKRNKITINEGVNIPRYFWTAFSCKSNKDNKINISNAYITDQIRTSTETKTETEFEISVKELNRKLRGFYKNKLFCVFGTIQSKE